MIRRTARTFRMLSAAVVVAALTTSAAGAATSLSPGLHNARRMANFYIQPAKIYRGVLFKTDLFEVVRLSKSGTYAYGHPWGDRRASGWIAAKELSPSPPRAPRGMTEVAGPYGSRVFRPAAKLTCRSTNFVTVGVRLRAGQTARVAIIRGGKVVARSRNLVGSGLVADQVRVPCNGAADVKYLVDGRSRSFAVRVSAG